MAFVTSIPLEKSFRRRTDNAYIIECDKVFHKKIMNKGKLTVIRRDDLGLEK